jgi:hypothetical protein
MTRKRPARKNSRQALLPEERRLSRKRARMRKAFRLIAEMRTPEPFMLI